MKTNSKKGFVIVELVIVIAVIAILAMALIPTFSGLIGTANKTADEMAIREMNTTLKMVELKNMGTKVTFAMAREALKEAGFNGDNLVPTTADCAYYWYETDNVVILVNKDGMIVSNDKYDHANITELDGKCYNLGNLPYPDVQETLGYEIPAVSSYSPVSGEDAGAVTLDTMLTFTAMHTGDQAAMQPYATKIVDYLVTVNQDVPADKGPFYLAGQYDGAGKGWYLFDAKGAKAGAYRLIGDAMRSEFHFGAEFTYVDICEFVQVFNCGVSVPAGMTGMTIKVELIMYDNEAAYQAGNYDVVNTYEYVCK